MTFETIQTTERPDRIGVITLNRPDKRNAISIRMRQELSACLERWKHNNSVGAVILTGAGEKAFVAGADIANSRKRKRCSISTAHPLSIIGTSGIFPNRPSRQSMAKPWQAALILPNSAISGSARRNRSSAIRK